MSQIRGAQRLAALRSEARPDFSAALERLATYLSEHHAATFETASADEIVDTAIQRLAFAAEANAKFCEINGHLDRVVSATVRVLRAEGFVQ